MAGKKKLSTPQGFVEHGGSVLSWEEGMEVEGIFLGMTPARSQDSSPISRIQTADGIVRYWTPAILESKLEDVEGGTPVIIQCFGRTEAIKSGKWKGTLAWSFKVYTKENSGAQS